MKQFLFLTFSIKFKLVLRFFAILVFPNGFLIFQRHFAIQNLLLIAQEFFRYVRLELHLELSTLAEGAKDLSNLSSCLQSHL